MDWFTGDISDAIKIVKNQSRLLLVFVRGADETSKSMENHFDGDLASACTGVICLLLDASSEAAKQFSAVYTLSSVPCIYLISPTGQVVSVKVGGTDKSALKDWIGQHTRAKDISESHSPQLDEVHTASTTPLSSDMPSVLTSEPGPSLTDDSSAESISQPCTSASLEDRVQRAYHLVEENRQRRLEQEKTKEIDDELNRRVSGRAMQEFKERQRVREIEEAQIERLKDKEESRKLRELLRRQLEDDRLAKEVRFQSVAAGRTNQTSSSFSCDYQTTPINLLSRNPDQIRLQIRLLEGGHLIGSFPSAATLAGDLRNWLQDMVQTNQDEVSGSLINDETLRSKFSDVLARGYRIRQLYPPRLFGPEEELQSMAELGLCPSAVLVLMPSSKAPVYSVQPSRGGIVSNLYYLAGQTINGALSYVKWFFSGLRSLGAGLLSSLIPSQAVDRPNPPSSERLQTSRSSEFRPSTENRAFRRQGNMARLSHMPDDSDDEQARWNGNSTTQL